MVTAGSPRGLPKAVKKIFRRKIFDCGGTSRKWGYGGISPHHRIFSCNYQEISLSELGLSKKVTETKFFNPRLTNR